MMDDIRKEIMGTFREELAELLSTMEEALLELEDSPDDPELVGTVFRALHTVKGNAAMFGFQHISRFAHELENSFDLVRSGKLEVSRELIALALSARDTVTAMVTDGEDSPGTRSMRDNVLEELRAITAPPAMPPGTGEGVGTPNPGGGCSLHWIRFCPSPEVLAQGANPTGCLHELHRLGELRLLARTEEIPPLEELDPETCHTRWDVLMKSERSREEIEGAFIFFHDRCQLSMHELPRPTGELEGGQLVSLLDTVAARPSHLPEEELLGELAALLDNKEARRPGGSDRGGGSGNGNNGGNGRGPGGEGALNELSSIRVPSWKLDDLVDLVGELVTVQARLSRTAADRDDITLLAISEVVERLTWSLRDSTFSIRMIPIGDTFRKYRRLVHDLSHDTGKLAALATDGGETELDKTVMERLQDPLTHLIRNSVGHGIERPEERRAAGKPETGTIRLSANQEGTYVVIRVSDDGRGLDPEKIRRTAEERGLLSPGEELEDGELFNLILSPGFTTTTEVTSLSGRGVGLDVVTRAVEELRGTLDTSSVPGEGTTFTIRLPLTLAIIEGLRVRVGGEVYVLPLGAVEECVELHRSNRRQDQCIPVRGTLIPFVPLRSFLKVGGTPPDIQQVVTVAQEGERFGLLVDCVEGEQKVVVKNLGKALRKTPGISGGTILGDGSVALILDPLSLYDIWKRGEAATQHNSKPLT